MTIVIMVRCGFCFTTLHIATVVYTTIFVYMYVCMHGCICKYVRIMYVCMYICMYVCMYIMYMYLCIYMYVCLCIYMYVCSYVCMFVPQQCQVSFLSHVYHGVQHHQSDHELAVSTFHFIKAKQCQHYHPAPCQTKCLIHISTFCTSLTAPCNNLSCLH